MESKRLYYIDWLRVLVILSLIPFHAALTYTRFGIVPIKAPVQGLAALPFLFFTVPLGDFFMTLLFFVSGMASSYSFSGRGGGDYMRERRNKLLIPFLLGWLLLLSPLTGYIQALYEGYGGGFLAFIPQFFWYQSFHYTGYGHLWFLLYLYVFSMLCVPLFSRWKKDPGRIGKIGGFLTKGRRLLLPAGFIILLELCLRPFFNSGAYILFGDWANDAVYLSLFVFGYVFASDARIQEKIREYYNLSKVFTLLGLAALFFVNIQSQVLYSNAGYLTPLWVIAKGVYECAAIIFLLNFGRNRMNNGGSAIHYLGKGSFTYYIFHYLPVTFYTFLFIPSKLNIYILFSLVVLLSYITVFLLYEFWRRVKLKARPYLDKRRGHAI